jgi:hypothetical protein
MDSETKQLILLALKNLVALESKIHALSFTLSNTSVRALAIEEAFNGLLPGFKENYDRRYADLQSRTKPYSTDPSLEEIRKAIDKLNQQD